MTTGSIDRSDVASGRYTTLSWTGADRPKVQYPKRKRVTVVRDGVTYRYLSARVGIDRPAKRVLDAPHAFTKSWYDMYSGDQQTYVSFNNNVYSNAVELQVPGQPGVVAFIVPQYLNGQHPGQPILTANDELRAFAKLREKLYGSDFNASVFLGESNQTLALIGDSVERISTSLMRLRRGDFAGAAKSLVDGTSRQHLLRKRDPRLNNRAKGLDSMSNDWLQLQYGWLPLIGDTHDAAQSLAHSLYAPLQTKIKAGVRREKVEYQTSTGPHPSNAPHTYGFRTRDQLWLTVLVKEQPSAFYQLGLMNPELVAWELMPWSFVIDWFLPIGQYLEARAAVSAVVGTYVTSRLTNGVYIPVTGKLKHRFGRYKRGTFVRTVTTTPPALPRPTFEGLDAALSWRHCVNSLALLNGLGSKLKPRALA